MNMLRFYILCTAFLITQSTLCAQKENNLGAEPFLWKKRVVRLVDTRDTLDEYGHVHRKEYGDTLLSKLLIEEVLNGDLKCYSFLDNTFDKPYKISEVKNSIFFGDTSISDKRHHSFRYRNVTKFRVMEEWEFDPMTLQTEINIVGLAPLEDMYYHDTFWYAGTLFWLKYSDVQTIAKAFMETHSGNNIQRYSWDDYFKRQDLYIDTLSKPAVQNSRNIWTTLAIRNIKIEDSDEPYSRNLYAIDDNIYGIQTLGKIFYDSVHKGQLTAYRDSKKRFENILPFDSIYVDIKADTAVEIDPKNNMETKVITKVDMDWKWFNQYSVMESWSYDPAKGKINIQILGIEPRFDKYARNDPKWPVRYKNLFWVRYADVAAIVRHYDEYHPLCNLSTAVWESYFKPGGGE